MPSTDTRAEEKARYAALRSQGETLEAFARRLEAAPRTPEAIPDAAIRLRETIPAGWYWTGMLRRGETLRITNTGGTPGVAAQFWNRDDRSERFNPADTIKIQWTARIGRGRVLLSDMGRAMLSVTDDSGGWHDCVAGCGLLAADGGRSNRGNFLIAAGKHGMGKADVHPAITFFAGVATDAAGTLHWAPEGSRPGTRIDLRAELHLLVALSNCPHPLAPLGSAAAPVEVVVWEGAPAAEDDLCRTGTEEAVRAFANTDALLARETVR